MSENKIAADQHSVIGYSPSGKQIERNTHPDAQWFFHPTKLGLFIHFGISTVGGDCDISWSMWENPERRKKGNGIVTPAEYWDFAKQFNPESYNPKDWLQAAKDAGFDYAVLTTRHHDGFAMWPSDAGNFSTKNYLNGRDLVKEYIDACREVGLKVGLYYSPPDWRVNQDYMNFMSGAHSQKYPDRPYYNKYHEEIDSVPEMPKEHLAEYIAYVNAQVKELLTRYGKIDVMWFDGTVPDLTQVISIEEIRKLQPGIVCNDRLWGYGDYYTKYECYLPTEKPPYDYWETCQVWHVGGGWSYVKNADKYVTLEQTIHRYEVSKEFGGNVLLNIAPDKDGIVPDAYYSAVKEFGDWLKEHR